MVRRMFHTQEQRQKMLSSPMKCLRDDAWLGEGYYFWYDLEDADFWGRVSKTETGSYEVYEGEIDCSNILDTVFNEQQYLFWLGQIGKVARQAEQQTGELPTLKELNNYLKKRGAWNDVDGILFQDIAANETLTLVKPIEIGKRKRYFAYRKRIQLVVFNLKTLLNFTLLKTENCSNTTENQ